MSDLFHKDVPFEFIEQVFASMVLAYKHSFQILTKRPQRAVEFFKSDTFLTRPLGGGVARNVWLGVSVEDQKTAAARIPILKKIPAAIRFLSCEPLLGEIDLTGLLLGNAIHWVIVGGESGPGARECRYEWIERIVVDCRNFAIPVFVKQLGSNFSGYSFPTDWLRTDKKFGNIERFPTSIGIREYPV